MNSTSHKSVPSKMELSHHDSIVMETIPDTMKNVVRDIQCTFEELVKLLLRKTLPSVLNPLGPNTRVVYNAFLCRYERGFVGSAPFDNINKYHYLITNDSLGWTNDLLVNFKVISKSIKHDISRKLSAPESLTDPSANASKYGKGQKTKIPYREIICYLTSKKTHPALASGKKDHKIYTADVPYHEAFRQLENIGKDIIDQTEPCIRASESAKMSTSMLRVRLYNLEQDLANLSIQNPKIFDWYIEMVRLINTIPKSKINWIINLIALLTFQNWDNLECCHKESYLNALGEDIIKAFNDNQLITILLQARLPEIILTASYLYPLLKMLFIVFGYSKLVPLVDENSIGKQQPVPKDYLKKYMQRYKGAFFRRGVCPTDARPCTGSATEPKPEKEPVDQAVYDFIKLFGDLYPTIIGLVGGTESFPPETIEIGCSDIPCTYENLTTVSEYLWRYNDYSYCRYLEYVSSKQMSNALASKINAKVRYLSSV